MLWVIIPVKSLRQTKSRLAPVLSEMERAALTVQLLLRQLRVLRRIGDVDGVLVVSRDMAVMRLAKDCGCTVLAEEADGDLNTALTEARAILADEAERLLILPSDLPLISAESIQQILNQPAQAVICSDQHGTGTNAFLLPAHASFSFAYGENSFSKHRQLLMAQHIQFDTMALPDVAFDLDTPDDWWAWRDLLAGRPDWAKDEASLDV